MNDVIIYFEKSIVSANTTIRNPNNHLSRFSDKKSTYKNQYNFSTPEVAN